MGKLFAQTGCVIIDSTRMKRFERRWKGKTSMNEPQTVLKLGVKKAVEVYFVQEE